MFLTIVRISLRNLIRQTRRSVLLGIAIAFGAMILVVANSFSRGISDVLFNQVVVYVSGHISVNFSERGNYFRQIFYNKAHIDTTVTRTVPGIKSREESIGVFGRAVGKGKSDNIMIVGMDLDAEISPRELERAQNNFRMLEGSFMDLRDSTVENPVILAAQKAEYLNVVKGDILRVRFTNALGQEQAARFTVVGIFKPSNIFMAFPVFVELHYLKPLMGYGPHQTGPVYINIDNPKKNAARYADSLHARLRPRPALIPAYLQQRDSPGRPVPIIGYKDDSSSLRLLDSLVTTRHGRLSAQKTVVTGAFATRYGMSPGDTLTFARESIHDNKNYRAGLRIDDVVTVPQCSSGCVLVNPEEFYRLFYSHWPAEHAGLRAELGLLDSSHPLAAAIAPEWELMERSRTTRETQKRFREMAQLGSKAVIVDVRSMYETASAILELEKALNLITVIAVLVLFFIILIGVVNTLRMAIRERTREIGTVRAIGMQRHHVRTLFITETTLLALIASIVGSVAALGVMRLLRIPEINAGANPMGMLLINGHLHFDPSFVSIAVFVALICAITATTAFFPARRAARMDPSRALHHFE